MPTAMSYSALPRSSPDANDCLTLLIVVMRGSHRLAFRRHTLWH